MSDDAFDPTRNDFEVFGLEPTFDVDDDDLQARYRELQTLYHPDRHVAGETREQLEALQAATRINEAYQTLRNPRLRARYLLMLADVAFDEERDTLNDPEFLMQQLELREALDDAQQGDDPISALDSLHVRMRTQRDQVVDRFSRHYDQGALDQAKADVLQLSFFERLLSRIDERLSALEDALG